MFHLVATEWRDARPGGRAADPGTTPDTITSVEVVRVRAKAASDHAGQSVRSGGWDRLNGFDSEWLTR
jgi:hypothetical protein